MNGPRIYNLFPTLAGPVARWSEHLSRIRAMRFDWIYVNPFTPTGGSGSLYAVADYRALSPALRGDEPGSDDDKLRAFTAAAREHGIRVLVDLVINHTADDASLTSEHPDWYKHDDDGAIAHPFAVDQDDPEKVTVWGDLAELDYTPRPEREALVAFVTDIAKYYASLGFSGFRCDAAYKVPGDVWKLVIDAVRAEFPDAVFLAETLGGPDEEVMQLGSAGFDFFFNSSKWWDFAAPWLLGQYETYREIAPSVAFPESHDTPRLAAELPEGVGAEAEYRFRYLFAASFSSGVMMPMGYEYGFAKQLDVVKTTPADWETPQFDLVEFVGHVNEMKAGMPVLQMEGPMGLLTTEEQKSVVLVRTPNGEGESAVLLVNPDAGAAAEIPESWFSERNISLLGDATYPVVPADAGHAGVVVIPPRTVRVFAANAQLPAADAASPKELEPAQA